MTQDQKMIKTKKMFDELEKIWGDRNVSIMIHGLDIKSLDYDKYDCSVNEVKETKHIYRSARFKEEDNLTFFD